MKKISLSLVMCLFSAQSFATTISLQPGSTATISAGDQSTVTCEGTAAGPGSGAAECLITTRGKTDKYGEVCGSDICASLYRYGIKVDGNYYYYNYQSAAAQWCDSKLGK